MAAATWQIKASSNVRWSPMRRAIATASLRDDVAVEGSGGWFVGDGNDFTGRFAECDFVYLRLKYYF